MEDLSLSQEEESEEEEAKKEDIMEFYVTIPPQKSLLFDFIFYPNSLDNENIKFFTNFQLVGISGVYKGLQSEIIDKKIWSIISISKIMVKFPKTFIYENTKNYKTKEIKIASENKKSAIIWKFINYENDKNFIEGIFSINNKEGEI